jgi:hypothetical protein
MYLGPKLRLVLQTENRSGGYVCEGFSGIPAIHPCYIVLATDGTAPACQDAERLRRLIRREIRNLDPAVTFEQVPCNGYIGDPSGCHAHAKPDCRKLLVLICTGRTPLPAHSNFYSWAGKDDTYRILPIVPASEKGSLAKNLSGVFSASNAAFYQQDISETVPVILSAIGLTVEEHRIFISYRRKDTEDLGEQLFDALSHEGFDVFLDRFRVPPALDFQRRLTQELADKSMVLVLESAGFADSEWTRYEVEFAVKHRLGLFALQTPGGKDLAGIDHYSRIRLTKSDFDIDNPLILNASSLQQTVKQIKIEHGRKMVWRRRILLDSMARALAHEGLPRQRLGPTGAIHVDGPGRKYIISLTPRPPELRDFHNTYLQSHADPSSRGLVVGPVTSQEQDRQQRICWLGDVSGVKCFDESCMDQVAKGIKGGSL